MAETTFTFKDASGTSKTALAGQNGSSQLAPAAVLYDSSGAELKGQKAMAASVPVVVASNQSAIPVADSALASLLADPATATLQSAQSTLVGAVTETAPATDTASSGLNGRLQRIAQRLTSLIALLPTSLSNGNLRVSLQESSASQAVTGTVTANPTSRAASTSDKHEPASNTAAIVTYSAGGGGVSHVITGVAWSYDGAPTGGSLKVEDGSGNTVFIVSVTAAGPGFIPFPVPKKGTANTAMIITLAAGGSGVTGKVQALNHWTES